MSWSAIIRLGEVHGPLSRRLEPDAAEREEMARELDLVDLSELSADLTVKPWFDGIEVQGRWSAQVVQTCGVSLERLESDLAGQFDVRVVPEGSLHAPAETDLAEFDMEADDPPEVTANGEVDLARLVFEHLALEIDPFPRAPGAIYEPPAPDAEMSPFAVLRQLKKDS